jgi:hypothetical protein
MAAASITACTREFVRCVIIRFSSDEARTAERVEPHPCRIVFLASDNDVVEQFDLHHFSRLANDLSESMVGGRGLRTTGLMVVNQDDLERRSHNRGAEYLARMNQAGVQGAAADLDPAEWSELRVERNHPYRIDSRLGSESSLHVTDDLLRAIQRLVIAESDEVVVRSHFIDLHVEREIALRAVPATCRVIRSARSRAPRSRRDKARPR